VRRLWCRDGARGCVRKRRRRQRRQAEREKQSVRVCVRSNVPQAALVRRQLGEKCLSEIKGAYGGECGRQGMDSISQSVR
jgi:hypothetical protein